MVSASVYAGFGHADLVHRVETGVGQQQGVGIGQADVFRGQDHQPAGDEARLFARPACGPGSRSLR